MHFKIPFKRKIFIVLSENKRILLLTNLKAKLIQWLGTLFASVELDMMHKK